MITRYAILLAMLLVCLPVRGEAWQVVGGAAPPVVISQTNSSVTTFFSQGQAISFTTTVPITLSKIRMKLYLGSSNPPASREIRIGATCDLSASYIESLTATVTDDVNSTIEFTSQSNPVLAAGSYCVGTAPNVNIRHCTSSPVLQNMSAPAGWQEPSAGTWNFSSSRVRYLYIELEGS